MSTAYVTMDAELGYESIGVGALCFSGVDSNSFHEAVDEVVAILEAGRETGTDFSVSEDDHGYHWVILEDDDTEDLITSMHFAADTFVEHDYGSRLLAAVFGYEDRRSGDPPTGSTPSAGAFYPSRHGPVANATRVPSSNSRRPWMANSRSNATRSTGTHCGRVDAALIPGSDTITLTVPFGDS